MQADRSESELIWFRAERARRGPRPTLSREEITRVAIELADAEGLGAVSIRRIAAKLGAGATSLYWYVSSKDDLHELMVDEVVGKIRLPEPSGDWKNDLREIARAIHATLRRHRWMVLLGIRPVLGPKTRRFGELAPRVFDPLDLDPPTRIRILAAVNNYLYGFVHREIAWEQARQRTGLTRPQWSARLRRHVDDARAQNPAFAEPWEASVDLVSDDAFEFGLDCLLEGVATQLREATKSGQALG
jgi:AcrR family transcriptional regulator